MSNPLPPHGLQHTRLPSPSPSPRVCSHSCPLSWWCHPTTSFAVFPFSSRLQSFPASGSFPMSQFFAAGGQSIGASASVLPMNIQGWFPLELTGLMGEEDPFTRWEWPFSWRLQTLHHPGGLVVETPRLRVQQGAWSWAHCHASPGSLNVRIINTVAVWNSSNRAGSSSF